jgi:hypothetical protein
VKKYKTSAEWKGIVELFYQSGLTQKAFCEKHNIKQSTFKNHVTRFRSAKSTPKSSSLIPVKLAGSAMESGIICLSLPNGVQIKAPATKSLTHDLLMRLIGAANVIA